MEHVTPYALAFCDGGYTTNVPVADLLGGQAWVAFGYGGGPLGAEHGGPARLLVPHLYFRKSAKWVRGLRLLAQDQPGFWENYGYNMYGDPWRAQRYADDATSGSPPPWRRSAPRLPALAPCVSRCPSGLGPVLSGTGRGST